MTDKETMERIEAEALQHVDEKGNNWEKGFFAGYLTGAKSERNKAIDECRIAITELQRGINHTLLEKLESLKL